MAEIRVTKPDNYDENTIIISTESNAPLMAAMFTKGLAAHENYMTLAECKAVTASQMGTFRYNENIRSFKEFKYFTNVTEIVQNCFFDMPNLEEIELPLSVKRIGRAAFGISSAKQTAGWKSKLKYITGCKNVEYCSINAFQYMDELISVDLSQKLKTISTSFNGCPKLESCGDLSGVEYFDDLNGAAAGLFPNCESLRSVYMPKFSIVPIIAFRGCKSLTNLTLDWDNITSIGRSAFGYNNDVDLNRYIPIEYVPSMPKLTTLVDAANFQDNYNIKYVGDMPLVTIISSSCFNRCYNIRSIGRLDNVEEVVKWGFAGLNKLEHIYLPKCTKVGQEAFTVDTSMEEVHRTIEFGKPYEEIKFNADSFIDCKNTTIICNGAELTEEQYQAVGAVKPNNN